MAITPVRLAGCQHMLLPNPGYPPLWLTIRPSSGCSVTNSPASTIHFALPLAAAAKSPFCDLASSQNEMHSPTPYAKLSVNTSLIFTSFASSGLVSEKISATISMRSEEHTSELQSLRHLVCRLL